MAQVDMNFYVVFPYFVEPTSLTAPLHASHTSFKPMAEEVVHNLTLNGSEDSKTFTFQMKRHRVKLTIRPKNSKGTRYSSTMNSKSVNCCDC